MPSLRQMKRTSSSESSSKELKKPRRESSRTKVKIPEPKAVIQPTLSPEQILQSSWKFLEFAQFCLTFKTHLGLPPLTIDSLESMLLNNEANQNPEDGGSISSENTPDNNDGLSSIYSNEHTSKLEDLILPLFQNLSHPKKLPASFDIGDRLLRLHKWYNLSLDGVKSSKPTASDFYQLTMDEKVDILYTLMENIMDSPGSDIGELCKSGDMEFKRYESIGTDTEGRSYWMFGGERLYREAPLSSVKRKVPALPNRPHTYELICQYPDDWRNFLKEIGSKRKSGKVFSPRLVEDLTATGEDVIGKHEQKERAILRREEKQHRAVMRAKAFENMPRKRSSRLEQKKLEQEEMAKLEEEMDMLDDIEAVRQYEAHEKPDLENSKHDMRDEIETAQLDSVLEKTEQCNVERMSLGVIDHESQTDATELTRQEIIEHTSSGVTESFRQENNDEHMQVEGLGRETDAKQEYSSVDIQGTEVQVSH